MCILVLIASSLPSTVAAQPQYAKQSHAVLNAAERLSNYLHR